MASQDFRTGSEVRAAVFLGLALVAGSAATMAFYQLMMGYERQIEQARTPERTVMAVIAANDLYPGIPITEEDIVGIEIPERYVHADALASADLVVGRIPRERILANEFVLPDRLADGATGVGLNVLVPPGMRAVSLNIDNGEALAGLLAPGNLVDVMVTVAGDGTRGTTTERQTLTTLQTVTVLAVDDRMLEHVPAPGGKQRRAPERSAPSVTLALTPEQAEQITLADRKGELHLSLRGDDLGPLPDLDATRTCDVLGDCVAPTPRRRVLQQPEGSVLEIWRAGQREEYVVP